MGDHKATLAKARMELEDMYLGVPDDSVNLTFQDLAQVKQLNHTASSEKKKSHPLMNTISESTPTRELIPPSNLSKLPSFDFNRGLQQTSFHAHHNHHANDHHQSKLFTPMNNYWQHRAVADEGMHANRGHGYIGHGGHGYGHGLHGSRHGGMERSMAYDDMSVMSGSSMASKYPFGDNGGQRRPGIPHSNICTICSVYIYMFQTRCLVCGRVYCRECVNIGMGEMTEGRKCVDCLGRRFSQRYIQGAGNVGCWSRCFLKYSSTVNLQELKWAEKGPRKSGENRYGRTGMMSTARIPVTPRTPTRAQMNNNPPSYIASSPYRTPTRAHMNNSSPSFVANSPYASPSHPHLPL